MDRIAKHVCMFSTGLSSAVMLDMMIRQYGKENVIPFLTDTLWEDEDNYRFMNEVMQHLEIEPTVFKDGRTPEQVFFDSRFLGNFGTAPCSKDLKMKQTVIFVEELRLQGIEPILYFGIGKHEIERTDRITYNYSHECLEPVQCRYPLTQVSLNNDMMRKIVEGTWKIRVPRMYDYGFSHANCAGRCVKGGIGHYQLLYQVWPDRYKAQEEMESKFRTEINDYTIMKKYIGLDREGKRVYRPYSLTELREDIERFGFIQQDMFIEYNQEFPCACII